jgi:hypothetical protein
MLDSWCCRGCRWCRGRPQCGIAVRARPASITRAGRRIEYGGTFAMAADHPGTLVPGRCSLAVNSHPASIARAGRTMERISTFAMATDHLGTSGAVARWRRRRGAHDARRVQGCRRAREDTIGSAGKFGADWVCHVASIACQRGALADGVAQENVGRAGPDTIADNWCALAGAEGDRRRRRWRRRS